MTGALKKDKMKKENHIKKESFNKSGVLMKESFYNENDDLEMEISFYENGAVCSISSFKKSIIQKKLDFTPDELISGHHIFNDGFFKIQGIYEGGSLKRLKTKNVLKNIVYNFLISFNLYASEAVELKKSEDIKAPKLT